MQIQEKAVALSEISYLETCIELPGGERPIRGTGAKVSKT